MRSKVVLAAAQACARIAVLASTTFVGLPLSRGALGADGAILRPNPSAERPLRNETPNDPRPNQTPGDLL